MLKRYIIMCMMVIKKYICCVKIGAKKYKWLIINVRLK